MCRIRECDVALQRVDDGKTQSCQKDVNVCNGDKNTALSIDVYCRTHRGQFSRTESDREGDVGSSSSPSGSVSPPAIKKRK